jgi:hypothetical protein
MAKRRAGNQTASLTPDHKKSGINLIYLATEGMPHTFGKLSTRATTLFQIAFRFKVCLQNYGAPKSQESQPARFQDSHLGVPGEKRHLDVGFVPSHKVYYKGKVMASPKFGPW